MIRKKILVPLTLTLLFSLAKTNNIQNELLAKQKKPSYEKIEKKKIPLYEKISWTVGGAAGCVIGLATLVGERKEAARCIVGITIVIAGVFYLIKRPPYPGPSMHNK